MSDTEEKHSDISTGRDATFTSYTLPFPKARDVIVDEPTEPNSDDAESDISWPLLFIPGSWGKHGLESVPWNDEDKPVVRIRKYEEIELNDEENAGVLTERIVASCSSYLDRCPQTSQYVLCKCDLSQKNLKDISVLTFHHYLQYLNLSGNRLVSLKPLSQMPFLMYLDVSHNMLTDVLNFKAPFNLTYVNYSYNYVDMIPDLSPFWSIVHLNLSHNSIYAIQGLEKLKYLCFLDISYNRITTLQNLNNMIIRNLNLEHNRIKDFEEGDHVGLKTLNYLVTLNLSDNYLKSLRFLDGSRMLRELIMKKNEISSLSELEILKQLRFLTVVDFENNACTFLKHYYAVCLDCAKKIVLLDGEPVTAENKVLAKAKFDPSADIRSGKKHADLFRIEQLVNFDVTDAVLSIDKPLSPIIILVGSPGSGQKALIRELYEKHKKYLRLGVSHTTRPKHENEIEGQSYYFVTQDEFDEMVRNGEFLTVSESLGFSYGFTHKELVKAVDEKAALIFHTELIAALNLRLRNLRPLLVLTLHLESDSHYAALLKKYCYSYWLTHNYKVLRINDDANLKPSMDSIISEVESILQEIISTMPITEGKCKKSTVQFSEKSPTLLSASDYTNSCSTDELDETIKHTSDEMVSLIDREGRTADGTSEESTEDIFHSISEVEFDFEPVLSVVSEHRFDEDSADRLLRKIPYMKPTQRIEQFIKSVLATREFYIEFHRENPGIFCETVFTDKFDDAIEKLTNLLKFAMSKKREPWHSYKFETDPVFEDMITDRLIGLHAEIYSRMHVGYQQK